MRLQLCDRDSFKIAKYFKPQAIEWLWRTWLSERNRETLQIIFNKKYKNSLAFRIKVCNLLLEKSYYKLDDALVDNFNAYIKINLLFNFKFNSVL